MAVSGDQVEDMISGSMSFFVDDCSFDDEETVGLSDKKLFGSFVVAAVVVTTNGVKYFQ